ncbi:hypothetical protein [Enterocloster clostridioformis]|uniref:hypothetical protein n=1 Tax=Enterocloster clostridioformis TaxID=1531 RepID=UPI0004195A28|nr:hypothetical protein [Enterocloster clostridioformis]
MTDEARRREINEAVQAGERALKSLRAAEEKLSSARNWGIFDMLGGGLITDIIKHSKINDASSYLETAKTDLRRFQKELSDIPDYEELRVDIGSFLSFADFFFDGLLVDYMVQSGINGTRNKVETAIRKVEGLLAELRRQI